MQERLLSSQVNNQAHVTQNDAIAMLILAAKQLGLSLSIFTGSP